MLATVRFTHRDTPTATSTSAASTTPIDGAWEASWTRAELAQAPMLMGPEEVNDENWGTYTLIFDAGVATETMTNPQQRTSGTFTYKIDGDTVTFSVPTVKIRHALGHHRRPADVDPRRLPRCRTYALRHQTVHPSIVSLQASDV